MSTIQITAEYRSWFKTIKEEFPDATGFFPKNLRYCRAFYHFYSELGIWQQAVAKFENDPNNQNRQQLVAQKEQLYVSEVTALYGEDIWMN